MHTTAKQSLVELKREREQVAVGKETVTTSIVSPCRNNNHYIHAPLLNRTDTSRKEYFIRLSNVDSII